MKINDIDFVTDLDENPGSEKLVLVDLEDGRNYLVMVNTPQNLLRQMEKKESNFRKPSVPLIIVRALTREVVKQAIYAEDDAYWLKSYGAISDTRTLDVLYDRLIVRDKFLDNLIDKGEPIDNLKNFDLIDFDSNNISRKLLNNI
jgi:hypothetical protein